MIVNAFERCSAILKIFSKENKFSEEFSGTSRRQNSFKPIKRMATEKTKMRLRKAKVPIASRDKSEILAALEAKAFRCIARGRAANLELGRLFLQIKAIVGHGRWERYYAKRFGSCGIAKRTAQTYMDLARKEDVIAKTADSAVFTKAMDPQAVKTRNATAKAEAEVGHSQNEKVRRGGIFRLPLLLTDDEQKATRELLDSSDWPIAQQEIIKLLKQLCVKFGSFERRTE
jgi:hypothetical protein